MTKLSEQSKPRVDQGSRMSLPQDQSQAAPLDDAEAQMRRALGLYGDTSRQRPEGERTEPGQRMGGGGFMGGMHRRRFVQDGEVPVTVVRRDSQESTATAQAGPTSSRLQRVEAALAAESAARDRADRALQDAQAALQALQTKIGHNELAKNEALAAAKRDREELVTLREETAAAREQIKDLEARVDEAEDELRPVRTELAEERRARKLAERLLRETTDEPALVEAEAMAPHRSAALHEEPARIPARRGRPPGVRAAPPQPEEEPEPVKWWLMPVKGTVKRR